MPFRPRLLAPLGAVLTVALLAAASAPAGAQDLPIGVDAGSTDVNVDLGPTPPNPVTGQVIVSTQSVLKGSSSSAITQSFINGMPMLTLSQTEATPLIVFAQPSGCQPTPPTPQLQLPDEFYNQTNVPVAVYESSSCSGAPLATIPPGTGANPLHVASFRAQPPVDIDLGAPGLDVAVDETDPPAPIPAVTEFLGSGMPLVSLDGLSVCTQLPQPATDIANNGTSTLLVYLLAGCAGTLEVTIPPGYGAPGDGASIVEQSTVPPADPVAADPPAACTHKSHRARTSHKQRTQKAGTRSC